MVVVADTSPLHYLVSIGHAELLPQLFERVLIPSQVRNELLDRGPPATTRGWATQLPSWAEIVEPDPQLLDQPDWRDLDLGERAALAVAAARQPVFLLIDEHAGRLAAQRRGFPVTGH